MFHLLCIRLPPVETCWVPDLNNLSRNKKRFFGSTYMIAILSAVLYILCMPLLPTCTYWVIVNATAAVIHGLARLCDAFDPTGVHCIVGFKARNCLIVVIPEYCLSLTWPIYLSSPLQTPLAPLFSGPNGPWCESGLSPGKFLQPPLLVHCRVWCPCQRKGHPVWLCAR